MKNLKFPIGEFSKPENITQDDIKNWITEIKNFPISLIPLTEKLTIEELNFTYRPDGWKIKQVIHHCSDSHMNAFIRFKLALTEEYPTIKPYEEALWANLIDGNDDDISNSLHLLKSLHHKWVLLLNSMTESQWEKTYFHPESKKTYILKEVVGLYAWHCNHHFAHIKQALQYQNKF
jgi:hypothetical protein